MSVEIIPKILSRLLSGQDELLISFALSLTEPRALSCTELVLNFGAGDLLFITDTPEHCIYRARILGVKGNAVCQGPISSLQQIAGPRDEFACSLLFR